MKKFNHLTLTTSPATQPTIKLRRIASLALRQRLLYGRPERYFTGKERDSETGLYYYGARYLDPKASRWLSGDPAVGEYTSGEGDYISERIWNEAQDYFIEHPNGAYYRAPGELHWQQFENNRSTNGTLTIINGHHRWLAAIQMGLKSIPIQIIEGLR